MIGSGSERRHKATDDSGEIGHGLSADWWQLGCLIYELLIGTPVFYEKGAKVVGHLSFLFFLPLIG